MSQPKSVKKARAKRAGPKGAPAGPAAPPGPPASRGPEAPPAVLWEDLEPGQIVYQEPRWVDDKVARADWNIRAAAAAYALVEYPGNGIGGVKLRNNDISHGTITVEKILPTAGTMERVHRSAAAALRAKAARIRECAARAAQAAEALEAAATAAEAAEDRPYPA